MKTYILLGLCCGLSLFCLGQSITNIEYYFNTDPGLGNGTAITANANSGDLTQTLDIAVPTDALGFNTLFIRTQDNNNIWSLYDKAIFYITDFDPAAISDELVAAEYYFNTDPGIGNATAITIDANTGTLEQTLLLPLPLDMEGFNTIYIRTQDDLGVWSLYDSAKFYVTDFDTSGGASEITAAEYFFNTDPGLGNASSLAVNANSGDLEQTFSIPLGSLAVGFHKLYLRTQDDLGEWSLYDQKLFYVREDQTVSEIVGAEYFYDTDPGIGNATPASITATGNPDEFTIDLATTDITCDFHDFYIRLQNADGIWSLYDYGEDVEVFDNADPTIVVFDNITVELDASGQGSITIDDVNNGTFDDCELVSVVMDPVTANYTCANLGNNTVTITATDAEDKVSTLDVNITVVDNINPVAVAQNITVQLDASGNASITPSDIENGSTDNCSITNSSLDITNFSCANLGANTVTFTVEDQSGNSNSTTAIVTVEDNVNPTASAQNITVQLDASGNASITADDIDQSTDNCSIVNKSIDVSSFTCANLGANTVTLTVEDQSGNMGNTTATVTVEDNINPTVVTQNITVQLDVSGNASITTTDIENGSTDNCSISSSSLDISSFTCANLGANTVTLSVIDQSNNTGSATAIVTVEDNVDPIASAQNITVQLDASGNASITADDIDQSTDNCSIVSKSIDVSSFDCSNLGANIVTLNVEDQSGNMANTTATITVEDNINPVVVTQNITVQLDASGNASITTTDIENGSADNCSIASSSLDITNFTCANIGANTVTLSVTDQSNNTGTATAIVTLEDSINPTAQGQDITIDLAGASSITITANDVDNGSSDNCDFSLNIDVDTFTAPGDYPVVLTITDSTGNDASVTVIVTVIDSILSVATNTLNLESIKIYPVPTKSTLFIKIDLELDSLTLFDLNGKQLLQVEHPGDELDVSSLSNGFYFIKFKAGASEVTRRIIKN